MSLFFSLLPLFVFGNLHCAGMCGPLVMLLAKHPYRWLYFVGRGVAFTLAGLISAEIGMTFFAFLNHYHISAVFSLGFGAFILTLGFALVFKVRLPISALLAKKTAKLSFFFGKLMANKAPSATFTFGLCTVLLPCGQTIIVFSIIALYAEPLLGLLNGFLFALFTSPALIFSLYASRFFQKRKSGYNTWMGSATIVIGALAVLRGLADLSVIRHLILNPSGPSQYHLVLF